MKLGERGESLIKSFEKLALKSYKDSGGKWTIGWGHTGLYVGSNLVCTAEQAETWFLADTGHTVAAVNAEVTTAINQNEFDALIAFGYNVGDAAERRSTLIRLLNLGDHAGAALEFPKWNLVNGKVVDGLTHRRAAEQTLFRLPVQA